MFELDEKMIEDGLISRRKHPKFDLFIHNYTAKAQYERVWNETTLSCRGLILDGEGNVVARPFSKFFNLGEYGKESKLGELPSYKSFNVFEKMDGSLGILYSRPDGKVSLATRGSFESEQALMGISILAKKSEAILQSLAKWSKSHTVLFEIIYPDNRIVVDYGDKSELVLLAIVDNKTGKDLEIHDLDYFARKHEFTCVNNYPLMYTMNTVSKVMEQGATNTEGYVIKFDTGLRIKMKYEEYVRLHRIITGVNKRTVWEMMRDGESLDELKEKVPDEFNEWLENVVGNLKINYQSVEHSCGVIVNEAKSWRYGTRKLKAKYIIDNSTRSYAGVCFAMLDNKNYENIIWKMLRPESETFK
jgi:RNA ligase